MTRTEGVITEIVEFQSRFGRVSYRLRVNDGYNVFFVWLNQPLNGLREGDKVSIELDIRPYQNANKLMVRRIEKKEKGGEK